MASFIEYLPIIIPTLFLLVPSVSILYIDNGTERRFDYAYYTATIGTLISVISLLLMWAFSINYYKLFSDNLYIDTSGYFLAIAAGIATLIAIAGSRDHIISWGTRSSFLSLSLLTFLGLVYMSFAYSIPVIFTSWAVSASATYAIVMLKKDIKSADAGSRYLIMGLVSSSLMLLGFSFYVVATKSLFLGVTPTYPKLLLVSMVLVSIAFLFKMGAFPFHTWLPDVYTMSDRVMVALVSSVGKIVGIAPLLRFLIFMDPYPSLRTLTFIVFVIISIGSLTIGNVTAFSRNDLAAILSFSSIAQVGFITMGFAMLLISTDASRTGIVIQTLAYVIAQSGLFLFTSYVETSSGTSRLEGLRGISKNDKALAFAGTVLFLSLLGVPPIMGFWGKLFIFESTFTQPWFTVIGVLMSAISAGYYIPPIREIFRDGNFKPTNAIERDATLYASILVLVLGILSPLLYMVII